jgi:hypothetical protein
MIVFARFAKQRTVKAAGDQWWRALHRVADALESDVRTAFLRAVRMVQAKLDIVNLEDAISRGQLDQSTFWQALESELDSSLRAPLREALLGGAQIADTRLPLGTMRFDLTNPAAVRAVDNEVANLVREITEESRGAIRDLVRQSVQGSFDVRQLARQVRGSIGLTSRYALAVDRYQQTLIDGGMAEGRAMARSQAYADRLLRHRAETIARTEVIRATSAGQQAVWNDAQAEGLLPVDAQRIWITTPDDRLCELCAPMDGQTVGLNEPFQSDEGPVDYPPLHPQCRCAIGIAQPEES